MSRLEEYLQNVPETGTQPDPVQTEPAGPAANPAPVEVDPEQIQKLTDAFTRMLQDGAHPYILLSTAVELLAMYKCDAGWGRVCQGFINGLFLLDGQTPEGLTAAGFGATATTTAETLEAVERYYNRSAMQLKLLRGKLDQTQTDLDKLITEYDMAKHTLTMPDVIEDIPEEVEK